jgi:rfaE bifunctional protein kinase chain/domain
MAYNHLIPLISRLAGHHILVVGDVILDEYLIGRADRLSREAPIPVLEFDRRDLIPGGAANPSANVVSFGSQAIQVGVVGQDASADALRDMLRAQGIDPGGLISDAGRPTTTKTRIMAHMGLRFPQQVARIDRIDRQPINGGIEQAVLTRLRTLATHVDAIMVSDYLTGLLTQPVVETIRELGREHGILITADAQGELDKYAGFDLVKCNADDAVRYAQRPLKADPDFAAAGLSMVERLTLRGGMLITRGPDGVTLVQGDRQVDHIPAPHIEDVYDTVGAGDTVLAVVTLALVAGTSYPDAAALANLAAGIVVRKVGNYAPSPDDLRAAVNNQAGSE